MLAILFAKSVLAGFALAVPVGPVGVLCVQRAVLKGRVSGLISGLGAAMADAFYGALAAFGVAWVAEWLTEHNTALKVVIGLLLIGLGVKSLLKEPAKLSADAAEFEVEASVEQARDLFGDWLSSLTLTVANPLTFIAYVGVFTTFGVFIRADSVVEPMLVVLGVLVGAGLWWLGIAAGAHKLRARLEPRHLVWLNRFAGVLLVGFGATALLSLFF